MHEVSRMSDALTTRSTPQTATDDRGRDRR